MALKKNGKKHVLVARTHHLLSWLYFTLAAILLLMIGLRKESPEGDMSFIIFALMGGLFLVHRHISNAAMQKQEWARKASTIIAILMLAAFPLGTLVGIFLLIHVGDPWSDD